MTIRAIQELFIHELSDIYSSEVQLARALPALVRASTAPDLRAAFEVHLEETHAQVDRIDQVVEHLGIRLKRIKCAAIEALVEEGKAMVDDVEDGPLRDIALISSGSKVEHYQIASYGMLVALAKRLGYDDAVPLLQHSLAEDKAAAEKFILLAEQAWGQRFDEQAA